MEKQVRTMVVFGAIIAIASGLTGAYASGFFVSDELSSNSFAQSSFMTGHLSLTVTDAEGNVQAYRQSDNIIVDNGEDCAALLLFGENATYGAWQQGTTPNACGGFTGSFNVIAIGNYSNGLGTGNDAVDTNTVLFNEHNASSSALTGFERAIVLNPTMTGASASTGAQVVLSNDFTYTRPADFSTGKSLDVDESGLFNSTTPNAAGMFAHQTFAPVTVDDTESLTVEWTINIGGTGNALGTGEET